MTKTGILSLILTVLLNSSLPGQTRPETSAGVFPVDLERYLRDEASRLLARRKQAVAAMKTTEQIHARQERLKADFRSSLGDLPERTPLNPRVVGTRQELGYRVERII